MTDARRKTSSLSGTARTSILLGVSPSDLNSSPHVSNEHDTKAIPANQLIAGIKQELQKLTDWPQYPDNAGNFDEVLSVYAEYYAKLPPEKQKTLTSIFWSQIEKLGTPIIESIPKTPGECNVYFLLPKPEERLADSKEAKISTKKDLYLQGDFHGYDAIGDRQKLSELSNTGIMWRTDSIPSESIVVYKYIQVESSYSGQKEPVPQRSPFFAEDEGFVLLKKNADESPQIPHSVCEDKFSKHSSPYGFRASDKIFRVSEDSNHAKIQCDTINWPSLLNPENEERHFVFHATLYSDKEGKLHRSKAKVTEQYHDDLYYSNGYKLLLMEVSTFDVLDTTQLGEKPYLIKDKNDKYKIWGCKDNRWQLSDIELKGDNLKIPAKWQMNQTLFISCTDAIFDVLKECHTPYLPYADFTRDIQVFRPTSNEIDDIVVINDGRPYLITGMLDRFEKMVEEGNLSSNTAFVFIQPLPGLEKALSESKEAKDKEVLAAYYADPSINVSGMGIRLIDYKHGIDQYIDFLDKLFLQLRKEIKVPNDLNHRAMIGSSLSGTASIYISLKRPDLFGAVIAQSPSPDNRAILKELPEQLPDRNIHLSCGMFEHPDYAAVNANVEYAKELSSKLDIPLRIGAHGHQFLAWGEELEKSLPETMDELHARNKSESRHTL